MLKEALQSIKGADHLMVLDDGSDFDVEAVVRAAAPDAKECTLRKNHKLTHEQRLTVPHVGRLINEAIRETKCGIIAYLCDDDLFHQDWLSKLRDFFGKDPGHVVYGGWNVFVDGEAPGDKKCPLGNILTTGNFAHRRSCSIEHGLWWGEHTVTIHDSYFVNHVIFRVHPEYARLDALAGWRREHKYNMIHYAHGHTDRYLSNGVEVLRQGMLEE